MEKMNIRPLESAVVIPSAFSYLSSVKPPREHTFWGRWVELPSLASFQMGNYPSISLCSVLQNL